jgi:leader peptidase (prepilin peptidase)/N-methyltransferase
MGEALVAGCVLGWLTALSIVDIRAQRLPNWLTVPGAVLVVLGAATAGRGAPALLGAILLCAAYLLVHLIAPAALGAGDVKLALGVGALTGAFGVDVWVLAALGAPLITAGVALLCYSKSTVPHGPSMCLTSAAAVALVLV